MIWKTKPTLDEINHSNPKTIHHALGIKFTAMGDDFLEATMPVDERTKQPAGLLHGGASVVLAESLGSVASALVAGPNHHCVGIEVNASHLNSALEGQVVGRVTPIRLGKAIHVWEIRIRSHQDIESKPVCISRLTVMVKEAKNS